MAAIGPRVSHLKLDRGRDLGDTGGRVPLKYLAGGDGGAFTPQCLENVIANCHSKRLRKREREDTTPVTNTQAADTQA